MSVHPANDEGRGANAEKGVRPPSPYGQFATVDGLGGVAAPLLAGFAVTMIALIVQIANDVRWPDVSLILLGAAAVLLLQVVQLNARARGYAVTPAQAREWYPDIERSPARVITVDWELRHHMECWRYLVRRARWRYNLAIVLLLCGIAVLLIPGKAAELTVTRGLAIAIIGFGAMTEAAGIIADWSGRAPDGSAWSRLPGLLRWAAPPDPPVPLPPLPVPPSAAVPLAATVPPDYDPEAPPGPP